MKKRYLVYLALALMIVFGFDVFGLGTAPVLPVIQLPGEAVIRNVPFVGAITNTFIATVVTYLIIIALALGLRAGSRSADESPSGLYNLFEMVIEMAYGYVQNAAGKWAKNFFPFFMTFILLILTANWLELIPGVDSVGKWESYGELRGHQAEAAALAENPEISKEELHHIYDEAEHEAMEANEGDCRNGIFLTRAENCAEEARDYTIVPFLRVSATDLNFTLAMALISVVMTQYYGFRAQGAGYLKKFFQFDANKIAKNPLGAIDIVVGLLELVAEFAKILSFSFRLLGNIFAGQVLLFVMASLFPLAVVAFYGLEFFVGAIQAVVFAMLTLTFMSQATQGHGHEAEEHH